VADLRVDRRILRRDHARANLDHNAKMIREAMATAPNARGPIKLPAPGFTIPNPRMKGRIIDFASH
jgi:hypothetical protein